MNKPIITEQYICRLCDFKTVKKGNYNAHIKTNKHKQKQMMQERGVVIEPFMCECGKVLSTRHSLSRHKKNCKISEMVNIEDNSNLSNTIIQDLIEENREMRDLVEQQNRILREQQEKIDERFDNMIPQIQNVTNNNIVNNNISNNININFFLNEQCKDAISIQNFIQNITVGFKELETIGDNGFINGMVSILTDNLGTLDIYQRPMHCIDLKREILYIKYGDKWKRDLENKDELLRLVKTIEDKNYDNVHEWQNQHPNALTCDTQDNERYLKIMSESLGTASEDTEDERLSKILRQISPQIYVGDCNS